MKVIICGAGQVGYGIAERLAAESHDVTVIDVEPKLIETLRDTLDVRGLVGHGAHPETLAEAGAGGADMLIAVTLYDEVNMVACQVAHSLFNVPTKIARIRSRSYLDPQYQDLFSRENMPIDVVISPEREVGEMVLRRIALPGAMDVLYFGDERIVSLAIECMNDCPIINTPLRQLSDLFPDLQTTVVGIHRGQELLIAHADSELQVGDITFLVCAREQVKRALSLFGHEESEANRIVIAGGGNIGAYVAQAIEKRQHRNRVKIIEPDKARAELITDQLRHTAVINGSALDAAILEEADIDRSDLLVCLTNQDQVNVLSGIMAKRLGCKANFILINNPAYREFTRTVGIDAYIDPRSVTVSKVLQQMRRGRIRSLYSVADGKAEMIEAQAMQTSPLVGRPLSDINLPEGIRMGAILRDKELIMPRANTVVKSGDRVIFFALNEAVRDVEQLFRVSLEYF